MRKARNLGAAVALSVAAILSVGRAQAATVTVDRGQRYQTIDGFGFFGAHDVWWGDAQDMVDDAWFDMVVSDLGITIWRNEIYPPSDGSATVGAEWDKMKPVVEGLSAKAKAKGITLKILLTVWSPPGSLKCAADEDGVRDGTPHPDGNIKGGGLCPSKRTEFANYLLGWLKLYAESGIEVYALSFQNEPLFVEPYNSCVYKPNEYADTLAAIGPILHKAYPNLKLFGSENMLAIECGGAAGFDPYWYTANVMKSPPALAQLAIWAVHGYTDGVVPTATSTMAKLWTAFRDGTASSGLPIWMTETSGYLDTIEGGKNSDGEELPGALDLGQAIYSALFHGSVSGWVWWQGSELGSGTPNEFNLMSSTTKRGKKYYVSKGFYRYVRPGARRVHTSSDDPEVMVVAFDHDADKTFTLVAINGGKSAKEIGLSGAALPAQLEAYRTSTSENAASVGPFAISEVALPPRSMTTLFATGVPPLSTPGGIGGNTGAGGRPGTGGSSGTGGAGGSTAGNGGAGGTTARNGGAPAGGRSGGAGSEGGMAGSGQTSDGGCGCSIGAAATGPTRWLLVLPVGALLVYRRGSRRRARDLPSAPPAGRASR